MFLVEMLLVPEWHRNNCAINYAVGYNFLVGCRIYPFERTHCKPTSRQPNTRSLSFDEASLAEPLACAINGLE